MPKSKRNKVVSLTRTQKRATRDAKASLIERIRDAVDAYPFLHLISVSSMRNASMQRVREDLKGRARFFFGKNRVVARALADRNAAAAAAANDDQNAAAGEYRPSLARVAALLRGPVGVCFATVDAKELQE
ncbi:mRNA turnover and ribosome assembly protein [Cladochytrium tenue]|nr:mRNA turnover and ribosome assembly protein [Cladochytrium tenue]